MLKGRQDSTGTKFSRIERDGRPLGGGHPKGGKPLAKEEDVILLKF